MTSAAERLKEAKARDEAGIEQDEPEAPKFEAPEPQPEPETPPTVPDEEEEAEAEQPQPEGALDVATMEALQKATAAYYKRVEKAFGPDNVPPECPSCNGLGFDLTGGQGEPDYLEASWTEQCDQCGGHGGALSKSKVADQRVIRCERCKGAGYLVTRPVPIENPEQVAPVVMALAEGGANGEQAAAVGPNDPGWEPWMGNPQGVAGQ